MILGIHREGACISSFIEMSVFRGIPIFKGRIGIKWELEFAWNVDCEMGFMHRDRDLLTAK